MRSERKVAPGESVDEWVARQPQGDTLAALRPLIHEEAPELSERVKWSSPWYTGRGPVVYLASQPSYATLGVCEGAHLDDRHGLLEGTGKAMRHVKVHALDDDLDRKLRDLIAEAVAFDHEKTDR